jgi:hypothetical protein
VAAAAASLRSVLQLPHTTASSLSLQQSPSSSSSRDSLLLPHTLSSTTTIPPAPPVHSGLQLSQLSSLSTAPPAPQVHAGLQLAQSLSLSSSTTRENLTLPHTSGVTHTHTSALALPHTSTVTPAALTTAVTRELQLPLTSGSMQLPQTADLSALSTQAATTTVPGPQVLHLPKSEIPCLVASVAPRDTLQLPRTSAPHTSDASR